MVVVAANVAANGCVVAVESNVCVVAAAVEAIRCCVVSAAFEEAVEIKGISVIIIDLSIVVVAATIGAEAAVVVIILVNVLLVVDSRNKSGY